MRNMIKRKVAIFDIDGTIFRSSLLIEIVEVMIEEGLFEKSAHKEYALEYKKWHDRKGDYEDYIMAIIRAFEKNVKIIDLSSKYSGRLEIFDDHIHLTPTGSKKIAEFLAKSISEVLDAKSSQVGNDI